MDEKPTCLICNKIFGTTKEYNIKQHYETNHFGSSYGKLHEDDRKAESESIAKQLNSERFIFQNMRSDNKKVLRSSFVIAHRIAKKNRGYSDDDFVKKCLINVAQEICSKMV